MLSFVFYFLFVIITTYCPSSWRMPDVVSTADHRWNPIASTSSQDIVAISAILRPICLMIRLFIGCSSVGDWYRSIEAAFAFTPSGKLSTFPTYYTWYCPTTSLLPPSLSYHISHYGLILHRPRHPISLFLYPSSCLSDKSLLLLFQSPHVSTTISAAILVHHPCHIAFLIPL